MSHGIVFSLALMSAGILLSIPCTSNTAPNQSRIAMAVQQAIDDETILDISPDFPTFHKQSSVGSKSSREVSVFGESDTDNDGLSDAVEAALGTDPGQVDSDCDGLLDREEVLDADGLPNFQDQDNDAITDALESRHSDSDNDGIPDDQDSETEIQIICARFAPFAITNDESTTFSVTVMSPGVSGVVMNPGAGDLKLYDDGTHGDRRAADGTFTRSEIRWTEISNWATDEYIASKIGVFKESGDYRELQVESMRFNLAPSVIKVPEDNLIEISALSENLWVSDRAVAIVDPELAARVWDGEAEEAVIRFLTEFGDRFDFVQVYPNGRGSPVAAAWHGSVVNTVEGIGRPIFNYRNFLRLPPDGKILGYHWQSNSPGGAGASTHEIMHQWQAYAGAELGLGQCVGSHWGILGQGRGVMGGFDPDSLVELSSGLYEVDYFSTCCAVGQMYTPLELYFAGLAPASEVPPMKVPVNANCASLDCSTTQGKCNFEAEGMTTVTIDELVEVEGLRNPGYGEAPTHFTFAHVLVTDVPPSSAELATVDEKARILEDPENNLSFYKISGARGAINTSIGIDPSFQIYKGHAGAWFNPWTSGQGLLIDIEPEDQFMFLAWFTYNDADSANPQEPHWFTAQGNYEGNRGELLVYESLGGKFDDPQQVTTEPVGTATVSFIDCSHGVLSYSLDYSGLKGAIPMKRLIPGSDNLCQERSSSAIRSIENVRYRPGNSTESVQINAGMNGAWFEPDTAGQGVLFDVYRSFEGDDFIFAAWFTYGDETASGQRWLTAQGGFEGSTASISVFETKGGLFDDPQITGTEPVGTMTIHFSDCSNATLTYALLDDGSEGVIELTRLLPTANGLCEELSTAQ